MSDETNKREINIENKIWVHGVCYYDDCEEIADIIAADEPVPKMLYREFYPEGMDLRFIRHCSIEVDGEDDVSYKIDFWSDMTDSNIEISCDCEDIDLSKIKEVDEGVKTDPLADADDDDGCVPVEYAQEVGDNSYSMCIDGDFDPSKLTLVRKNGFFTAVKYGDLELASASGDVFFDAEAYGVEYRYLNDGEYRSGEQTIWV